jgi:hypothetical protein
METKQIIETFFEEQLKNTSQYFLYKDKQMLKKGQYIEFAKEQIGKAKNIALGISGMLLIFSWYGIINLIEYGNDPNWFKLGFGLFCWAALMSIVFYASKEYYTIKSSMSLFIKMMEKDQKNK